MSQSTLGEYQSDDVACPECGRAFDHETAMKIHYGRSHEGSIAGTAVTCDWCGADFTRQPAYAEQSDRNFCSRECWREWRSDFVSGDGNPMHGVDGEDAPAYWLVGKAHPMHGRTGDDNPMGGVTGPDHPHWKGGHTDRYGSNWKRVREQVIERDGGVCQMADCAMTREAHCEEYGRDISVHHITRKELFARWAEVVDMVDLEDANVPRNLITLCIKCHNRVDKYGRKSPVPDSHWRG